jgi:hypothetical protein
MTGTVPDLPDLAAQRKNAEQSAERKAAGPGAALHRRRQHTPAPCRPRVHPGTPRDPQTRATVAAQPLPAWAIACQTTGKALGYLGKDVAPGIIQHARQMGVKLPPQPDDPSAELTPQLIVEVIRDVAFHYFPKVAIATEPTG